IIRTRGLERGSHKREKRDPEAARADFVWGVFERNPLMDDRSARLRQGDTARLQAHRLVRILAVPSVEGQGSANLSRRLVGAARDRSRVVVRDLEVDELDRVR